MPRRAPSTVPVTQENALVHALELDIVFGRLEPGERLIEDDLIARFGQSRHRVRRGIDELVEIGLAARETNKGARVCSYTPDEIRQIHDLRDVLEDAAIQRISLPPARADIAALRALHARHTAAVEAGDLPRVLALNAAFHKELFELSGNPRLCETLGALARRMQPLLAAHFAQTAWKAPTIADHEAMLRALEAGDRAALAEVNRAHLWRPAQTYLNRHADLAT